MSWFRRVTTADLLRFLQRPRKFPAFKALSTNARLGRTMQVGCKVAHSILRKCQAWVVFHTLSILIAGLLFSAWLYSYGVFTTGDFVCLQDYRTGGLYIYTVLRGGFVRVWDPLPPSMYVPSHLEWSICYLNPDSPWPAVPLWPFILCSFAWGLYPFIPQYKRWQSHENERQGRCNKCGYDLTGNTSGVCPECGMAMTERGASAKAGEGVG